MAETKKGGSKAAEESRTNPKVVWDDTKMNTSYANVANVTSTREEVTLFFGTNQTWNANEKEFTVLLSNRLIVSPYTAKRLSLLLNGVLKEYESRYGTLSIEKDAATAAKN